MATVQCIKSCRYSSTASVNVKLIKHKNLKRYDINDYGLFDGVSCVGISSHTADVLGYYTQQSVELILKKTYNEQQDRGHRLMEAGQLKIR